MRVVCLRLELAFNDEIVRLSYRGGQRYSVKMLLQMISPLTTPHVLRLRLLRFLPGCVAMIFALLAIPDQGNAGPASDRYDSFRFGVCYYPEQWPEKYWEQDA